MNPEKNVNDAITKKRIEAEKAAAFYMNELKLMTPYRDYLKCKVEIMELNLRHDNMIAEMQDLESRKKMEEKK